MSASRRLTVEDVLRHVKHRYQQCEWAVAREEPYYDLASKQDELEALEQWIENRWRKTQGRVKP